MSLWFLFCALKHLYEINLAEIRFQIQIVKLFIFGWKWTGKNRQVLNIKGEEKKKRPLRRQIHKIYPIYLPKVSLWIIKCGKNDWYFFLFQILNLLLMRMKMKWILTNKVQWLSQVKTFKKIMIHWQVIDHWLHVLKFDSIYYNLLCICV